DESTALNATALGLLAKETDAYGVGQSVGSGNVSAGTVGSEITLASGAHLTVAADGSYVYDPHGAFESLGDGATATDSFTYTATEGRKSVGEGNVRNTINGAHSDQDATKHRKDSVRNTP